MELKVLVYNINKGYNNELKERCRPLFEYCTYMDKIRDNLSNNIPLEKSVDKAINECIEEGVMADFLRDQRSEVRSMSILECDFDEEIIKIRRNEREIGEEKVKELIEEINQET